MSATPPTIPVRWKITRDRLNSGDYADMARTGWEGPRNGDRSLPLPIAFRLLDADGEVIYDGRAANEESLAYAQAFGMADAGAITLQVRENGRWADYF